MKRNVSIDKIKAIHKIAMVLIMLLLVGCNSGSDQSQPIANPPNTPNTPGSTLPPYQSPGQSGPGATSSPGGASKPACPNACLWIPSGKTQAQVIADFEAQNNCVVKQDAGIGAAACQPVAQMSVSSNYLNIKLPEFEGEVPQYYNDSKCNCTAGIGHLVQHGQCPANLAAPGKQKTPQATDACVKDTWWKSPKAFPGASVSKTQIETWAKQDIAWAERLAKQALSGKNVTQTEFDAVVDLIYNGGFSKYYSIKTDLKSGNFKGAIQENTRRGKNNHLQQNRVNFENSGLSEGDLCK
ncbi:glycoside hydrolase family protein [Halothiobacillus sp.]|jgi:GH24 family phage-related lysozyme (muramidase)|uniref:glycoside hydrolase family protein n=1 Tax=Halothiobacillus sp. TaxID=1891311 RepID=UPI002634A285|nr:glycoside hydrolase family protein [Halothiobacillus sp.]MDD4967630.1 glycoside hydrolase family protein [Halothiobacillus sp.]MDY0135360.1 glycoside hydrolase family protein [Atribacterota bacterium]